MIDENKNKAIEITNYFLTIFTNSYNFNKKEYKEMVQEVKNMIETD